MTQDRTHQHQVMRWTTEPFQDCVAPSWCNPKAHGHLTDTITCFCGAIQHTNVNREFREIGPWRRVTKEER